MKSLRTFCWPAARVVALLYAGIALLAWLVADRLMFQPRPASYGENLPGFLRVTAADGIELAVLHLPNPLARHTAVYFHGNAEDLGDCLPVLRGLHRAGFGVLAFDYRGYGRSAGRASERNLYADTRSVLEFAHAKLGLKQEEIVAIGRSLGSGPAVELAANGTVAGLVLISPFTSAFRVMTRVKVLPFDRFDNLAKIGRVTCPTLVFHGVADEVIPFSHGEKLFAAMREPKRPVWILDAGHNDVFSVAGDRILREVVGFGKGLPLPRAL